MKRPVFLFSIAISVSLVFCNSGKTTKVRPASMHSAFHREADREAKQRSSARALKYGDSMRNYLRKNGYSSRLLFIADMHLHVFIKRFYAIQLDSNKIIYSSLVAHGKGKGSKWDSVVFSNVPGSLCTSKGKYKIGKSYFGEFGKGYKLHGLDASNSNALKRLVVFHAFNTQTEEEYSRPNYLSSGCPMLAPGSFAICDSLIQKETKPVMMVIY